MTESAPSPKFPRVAVAGVGLIHFIHDIYTALLAPVLPLLIRKLQMSFLQAGSLVLFLQGPSILNPFLGAFIDRRGLGRTVMALTPGLTAVAVCLMGLAPSWGALAVVLLTAGISVAGLHVSAPVMVARMVGREHVGRGMGWFMMGGELARTAGPLVAVWAVSALSLEGLWMLAPVGVAASALLWWRMPRIENDTPRRVSPSVVATVRRMRRVLGPVFGVLVARSMLGGAMVIFLPTYLEGRGQPLWLAGASLSIYQIGGALGALRGGALSDRVGRRPVLLGALLLGPLAMVGVLYGSLPILVISLFVAGVGLVALMPVLLATVMEHAGDDTATANGIYMATSFAVRALVVLGIGALSDVIGMHATFHFCAVGALLGIPLVFLMPSTSSS